MTSVAQLPTNWRAMTVKALIRWLRDNGGAPPHVDQFRRHELVAWIERYMVKP